MLQQNIVTLYPGAVLALARWGASGGPQFQLGAGAQYAAELRILLYFAAELRILLVYLSESLGRLSQNGGPLGGHIFHWGPRPPPIEPPLIISVFYHFSGDFLVTLCRLVGLHINN